LILVLVALIGIILLIGIVKKTELWMVDFAIVAPAMMVLSRADAIRRAAILRFRPL
jgi:multidrug efflux pump subunit AcrB